jgi:hypothetical integral membrane protein (TIGR02206 family)
MTAGRLLALVILVGWVGEYAAEIRQGTWSVRYNLPLQLTDAVTLVAVAALLTRRMLLIELVWFWSLTASLQAVLTPDLAQNFPSVYYFTYFIYHIGAVVAACFLVLGLRHYPRPGAAWRVFAVTLAFTAVAGAMDVLTGGNYMYLRARPAHTSLLNFMGSWPWYVVSTAVLAMAMLLGLGLVTDWLRRHDRNDTRPARASPE